MDDDGDHVGGGLVPDRVGRTAGKRARRAPRAARVRHLDPTDRARPAHREGHEVVAVARGLVPDLDEQMARVPSEERVRALRDDLDTIRRAATEELARGTSRRVAGPRSEPRSPGPGTP